MQNNNFQPPNQSQHRSLATSNHLQPNILGILTTASLTAAYMGPALSIYALLGPMTKSVGEGTGFVLLIGATMTMLSAISFGMLAKEMPSAGGVYTWGTKSLGNSVGHCLGITSVLYFIINMIPVPLIFGQYFQRLLETMNFSAEYGRFYFIVGAFLMMAIAASVVYRGIVVSSHLAFTLLMIECVVVAVLAISMAVHAYQNDTLSIAPMRLSSCRSENNVLGMSAVFMALPMAFMCMTCDAAVPTGEETRNAKWTIPVAIVVTCLIVGVWYVFGFTAFSCALKTKDMSAIPAGDGELVTKMAGMVWGNFSILVPITAMTAALGCFIPGTTGASRALFAMSRDNMAPQLFARLNPRYASPWNAFHLIFVLAFLCSVIPCLYFGPDKTINWWSLMLGWFIGFTYLSANVLNIVYYWRFARKRFNWILNGIVPLVAIGAQGYAIYRSVIVEPATPENLQSGGRYAQIIIVALMISTLLYVAFKRNQVAQKNVIS